MKTSLQGTWQMSRADSDTVLDASIPGSIASTLLSHGLMDDPYCGSNELKVLPEFDHDYVFSRSFFVKAAMLAHDEVLLCFEGLDTLCEISLNGKALAVTDNMHRRYLFDVKALLHEGENTISLLFRSAANYLKENPSRVGKKHSVIRKAACMFGWDWGLNLPDAGIWRDITLQGYNAARLSHVQIAQTHEQQAVTVEIGLSQKVWGQEVAAHVQITAPGGEIVFDETAGAAEQNIFKATIESPALWWPVGYGKQPLYTVKVSLVHRGVIVDTQTKRIGLRTVVLCRDQEKNGSAYAFIVNGKNIFFRGENLIIEDAILQNTTPEKLQRLVRNCLLSNLNGIRVWGGAYYPSDILYDLCDEYGLMVYQDFMFACTFYATNEAFLENVRAEAEDNVKRIAHHACLAVLCGNNEIDAVYTVASSNEERTVALRKLFGSGDKLPDEVLASLWQMYSQIFLDVLPDVCSRYTPQISYVHASPSVRVPGGATSFFDYLSDGDMHYYLQYDGNAPYQSMRKYHCRFMTEIGFQSYPAMKTLQYFAKAEDLSPYTPVMYAHQKCASGNEAIEEYMRRDYRVPTDFAQYVYLSQILAGEIMRYTIEHFRRDNGYCRGTILWQLNDCWPVVSWSGIDYFGRWKALQYFIKRFYAPVLVSAAETEAGADIFVSNESGSEFNGTVFYKLRHVNGTVLQEGSKSIQVACGASIVAASIALNGADATKVVCTYLLQNAKGECIGADSVFFCLAKDFAMRKTKLTSSVIETKTAYEITVHSTEFAKGVALELTTGDCVFNDNWFYLANGESRTVLADKRDIRGVADCEDFTRQLTMHCLNDILGS